MKISEGWFDNIENLYKGVTGSKNTPSGFSAFKNWQARRKSGLSKEQQLAYDNFVKKFVTSGINAINTAVKAGLVDVQSGRVSGSYSVPQKKQKGTTNQQQVKKSSAKTSAPPAYKPIVRKDKTTGEWLPVTLTYDGIKYTKTNKGWMDDKNQLAKQDYQTHLDKILAQSLAEAIEYIKMQRLYENIVSEAVKSISQWTKDHFVMPYLQGIDLTSASEQINAILQNLPNSYANNTLADDLTKIADIAWAIEMASQARKIPGTY